VRTPQQKRRLLWQAGFFALFVLAPPLDILRLDAYRAGLSTPGEAAFSLFWRGVLPLFALVVGGIYAAWRWGRFYCGWLCPHFSVVELINGLMLRSGGKPSLWEKKPLPALQADGTQRHPNRTWWPVTWLAALFFAFLWALTLLTYLLPPFEIYHNLLHAELTPNQFRFLAVGTALLFIEFMFARHLFCRFGCAVGLFQSLAWMGNNRALVVGFNTQRASECGNVCPMRLKPRTIKRRMFTCTECAACVSACSQVKAENLHGSLLSWVDGDAALPVVTGRPVDAERLPVGVNKGEEHSAVVQPPLRSRLS